MFCFSAVKKKREKNAVFGDFFSLFFAKAKFAIRPFPNFLLYNV